jgi:hypothetical protein
MSTYIHGQVKTSMEPRLQKMWFGTTHIIDIKVETQGRVEEPFETNSNLRVNFTRGNPGAKGNLASEGD